MKEIPSRSPIESVYMSLSMARKLGPILPLMGVIRRLDNDQMQQKNKMDCPLFIVLCSLSSCSQNHFHILGEMIPINKVVDEGGKIYGISKIETVVLSKR